MTKIKICGLSRPEDIEAVNEAGPDYAGFILHFPKSHRNLDVQQAASLRQILSGRIRAVCVFVNQPSETVLQAVLRIRPDVIQLHGAEDGRYIKNIREMTGLPVWKAFRIRSASDLEAAEKSPADEILLDNGYGTGAVFDWSKAEGMSRPFLLAGGLTPGNIPDAIDRLHPLAVDISSGVETGGVKDRGKILAAVRAAHR